MNAQEYLEHWKHGEEDRKTWNKCDVCGRFISLDALSTGLAVHRISTPDSDHSSEEWETLCGQHRDA